MSVTEGITLVSEEEVGICRDLNSSKALSILGVITSAVLESCKMSRLVRKPAFCICETKDTDQLRGNREADQRLCFCYTDSTIPLLPKSEISNL